eukprot:8849525-Heterocapsa_arctica.AAC.1
MKYASSSVRSCSRLLMRRCEDFRSCSLEVACSPASLSLVKISVSSRTPMTSTCAGPWPWRRRKRTRRSLRSS